MGKPKHTRNSSLTAELIQGFGAGEDGVHLHGGEVFQCFVKPNPNIPLDAPHLDAFQLIYPSPNNAQYALALIEWFGVTGSVVDGLTTPIQCIFASDGVFGHGEIHNNTLKTDGHHFISLNGLLSGSVTGNRFIGTHASDFPIKFKPARPGGNPDGEYNVWILHWKDDYYQYGAIECDTPELVQDLRQTVFNTTDKFLVNFDQEKFDDLASRVPKAGGREMGRAFQKIALECGDLVTEYQPRESVIMAKQMKMSDAGLERLIEEEGSKPFVYIDVPPDGYDTVGVGHKVTDEEKRKGVISIGGVEVPVYQDGLTETQIAQLLRQDIESREVVLSEMLGGVDVNQRQFDALLEFMFNVGRGAFKESTLLERLKAGKFEDVPDELRKWNIFKGAVLPALADRRERTIQCWLGVAKYHTMLAGAKSAPALRDNTDQVAQRPLPKSEAELRDEMYAEAYSDLERKYKQDATMETKGNQTGTRTTLDEVKQRNNTLDPDNPSKILRTALITAALWTIKEWTGYDVELSAAQLLTVDNLLVYGSTTLTAVFRTWFNNKPLL